MAGSGVPLPGLKGEQVWLDAAKCHWTDPLEACVTHNITEEQRRDLAGKMRAVLRSEPRLGPTFHLRELRLDPDGAVVLDGEVPDVAADPSGKPDSVTIRLECIKTPHTVCARRRPALSRLLLMAFVMPIASVLTR